MDLIIIILLTIITAPVVELTEGIPRIVLGVLFLLLFPGYTLMASLFPRRRSMDFSERITLSLGLSVAVVSLTALALNYSPWGIRLVPVLVATDCLIAIFLMIAFVRRRSLAETDRFRIRVNIRVPHWGNGNRLDRALSVCVAISMLGAIGLLIYAVAFPRAGEHFTEFYILGSEGKASGYERQIVLGDDATVTLGIGNHEKKGCDYRIAITLNGEQVLEMANIMILKENQWSESITVVPSKVGEDQKLAFILYKGEERDPYRNIHLWLDVKEKQ